MQKIKYMKKVYLSLIGGCFIASFLLSNNTKDVDIDPMLLNNIEALTYDEYPAGYSWSGLIDCPGWFTGDYNVCEEGGPGNPCTDPGAKTCDCGVNC